MKALRFKGSQPKVQKKKKHKKLESNLETIWVDGTEVVGGLITIFKQEYLYYNQVQETIGFKIPLTEQIVKKPEIHVPWLPNQVFTCQNIEGKYYIKSCFEKYITCTKDGVVSCNRDAAGIDGTWVIERYEDGFVFISYWNTYLSLLDSTLQCLPTKSSFSKFYIQIQNRKVVDIKPKESVLDLELEQLKQFHTKGSKHIVSLTQGGLIEAKKSGKLHEELLNRRELVKRDKLCR
jgi:protein FRG1